ncbi:glutamine synthetase beta-grasp domain-containing protein, partial [Streptococcus anginosus]|nr:glutamine synthetase beta-grasp domain-containing protein [Streptococcus anginosus]
MNEGYMFDGSSIRGFTSIHESDMKLLQDVSTAFVDPFRAEPTLVMNFNVVDPYTDEPFARDPRNVAERAEAYLRSTGIADTISV